MRVWQYVTVMALAALCVAMSVATAVTAWGNQRMQSALQAQQAKLSGGVLGPQGQQISAGVLQDMAGLAVKNSRMRALLSKHGYTVQNPPRPSPAEGAADPARKGTRGVAP
jgi:hypothetical protein